MYNSTLHHFNMMIGPSLPRRRGKPSSWIAFIPLMFFLSVLGEKFSVSSGRQFAEIALIVSCWKILQTIVSNSIFAGSLWAAGVSNGLLWSACAEKFWLKNSCLATCVIFEGLRSPVPENTSQSHSAYYHWLIFSFLSARSSALSVMRHWTAKICGVALEGRY